MEKKDLLKKQELAERLGMKFNEVSELFSEETLYSMQMTNYQGRKGGVDIKSGCDSQTGVCTNPVCPSTHIICFKIYCPSGEDETTPPPYTMNTGGCESLWGGCPTMDPPTPPTVQQDAICWQTPPLPPIIR